MKYIKLSSKSHISLLGMVLITMLSTCKKDDEPKLNVVLYDKPLDVIKSHVQGEWKLQKAIGGLCGSCNGKVKDNPYLAITGNHYVSGTDKGVSIDTLIVWQRIKYNYRSSNYIPSNDSTYLLSIRAQRYYAFPINYVVDRIENNNLVLMDYASDPVSYYFTK